MNFPLERLQILDYSEYDKDGNIKISCFDVAMSFFSKSEAETVKEQIILNTKKAEILDNILPFLQKELTAQQIERLKIISDPFSLKILSYLAETKPSKGDSKN